MTKGILEGFVETIQQAAKKYGPLAGLLLMVCSLYVRRDWQREVQLNDRIDGLEMEMRRVVLPLVKECTEVSARSAEVITRNTEVIARNLAVMERMENASRQP